MLLILHTTVRPEAIVARGLSITPLVWLGQRSYGVYLWHLPAVNIATHQGVVGLRHDALALVLTAVATLASWRFVEQPFLRRKSRFERARLADGTATTPSIQVPMGAVPETA